MKCRLVDVFAERPLSGNGLTIFFDCDSLTGSQMLQLTREMRQFESIFVCPDADTDVVRARIFTMEEELDFAGHPLLGLVAHLHAEADRKETPESERQWRIRLNVGEVSLTTRSQGGALIAEMNQGQAAFLHTLTAAEADDILPQFGLGREHLGELPLQVVSTGLPYLIIPVINGLGDCYPRSRDLEPQLQKIGAKFAYILDVNRFEGRTWDNLGTVEDIATGSAAGPAAAFLCRHGLAPVDEDFILQQGRFVHRPSQIKVRLQTRPTEGFDVWVSGQVEIVADLAFRPDLLSRV